MLQIEAENGTASANALFLALVIGVMGAVGFALARPGRAHACIGPTWTLIDQELSLVDGVGDEEREREQFIEEFGETQVFEGNLWLYLGSVSLYLKRLP